jgi:hypothetical protein
MSASTISSSSTGRTRHAPSETVTSFAALTDDGAVTTIPSPAPAPAAPLLGLTAAAGFTAAQAAENR